MTDDTAAYSLPKAPAKKRTATGARLVDVAEVDPVTERGALLDELAAAYAEASDAAYHDYRAETAAAWERWQDRLNGLAADYQSQTERIRSGQ